MIHKANPRAEKAILFQIFAYQMSENILIVLLIVLQQQTKSLKELVFLCAYVK